jgi:hypothetical protein
MNNHKAALIGIAALLLATGTAHAQGLSTETDDVCFVVKQTSDGFLAVRDEPDAKAEMFAALRPGFSLIAARDQFVGRDEFRRYKHWTKWVYVRGRFSTEDAEPSYGWVYRKYLKEVPCK